MPGRDRARTRNFTARRGIAIGAAACDSSPLRKRPRLRAGGAAGITARSYLPTGMPASL